MWTRHNPTRRFAATLRVGVILAGMIGVLPTAAAPNAADTQPGEVRCARLTYGLDNKRTTSCFAEAFLADAQRKANVQTHPRFDTIALDSAKLFDYPFVVLGGEHLFRLTETQVTHMRDYLKGGGFMIASANCSSQAFDQSFRNELLRVLPDAKLQQLKLDHPLFHTVYDITELKTKRKNTTATIEAVVLDGRIVLVYSSNGLADTDNAGKGCCCCGGNEITNARQVNVNMLIYALTH